MSLSAYQQQLTKVIDDYCEKHPQRSVKEQACIDALIGDIESAANLMELTFSVQSQIKKLNQLNSSIFKSSHGLARDLSQAIGPYEPLLNMTNLHKENKALLKRCELLLKELKIAQQQIQELEQQSMMMKKQLMTEKLTPLVVKVSDEKQSIIDESLQEDKIVLPLNEYQELIEQISTISTRLLRENLPNENKFPH